MLKRIARVCSVVVLAGIGMMVSARMVQSQATGGAKALTLGIYTPSVPFANAASRLQYAQRLAKAIEVAAGVKVTGKSYASLGALKRAKVDFAIVDAQCYAINMKWSLLANGKIGGKLLRPWALFSRLGGGMPGLQGKKLSYIKMGCRDADFVFNAMLESEVTPRHFSSRVGKPNLQGAVAEVASFKGASAVFAPVGSQKGLTKVFATGSVPGPAFVRLNARLSASLVSKVAKAVVGYGGGGAISGWARANSKAYASLRSRMARRVKRPVFASPVPVRLSADNVIKTPETLARAGYTEVKQHFEEPPPRL